MNQDLTNFLREWPRTGRGLDAREIELADGRTVLQIRVALGILQMEVSGRPDEATEGPFSEDDELALRDEVSQFDARVQVLLLLGRPGPAALDADHMRACALQLETKASNTAGNHALLARSITLRGRAVADAAIARTRRDLARLAIDDALSELQSLLSTAAFESSNDVRLLQGMKDLLVPRLPGSQRVEFDERLQEALRSENYELAAILRDELRQMR
jgi:hypothetical protein